MMYLAKDGNYGDATDIIIAPWFVLTAEQLEELSELSDNDRWNYFVEVTNRD